MREFTSAICVQGRVADVLTVPTERGGNVSIAPLEHLGR